MTPPPDVSLSSAERDSERAKYETELAAQLAALLIVEHHRRSAHQSEGYEEKPIPPLNDAA
jgi:hypothetical protein